MKWIVAALLIAFASASAADPIIRLGVVNHVSDGDTAVVCGTQLSIFEDCVTVRVNGLNTPEKRLCKPGDKLMKSCEPCRKGAKLGVIATAEARRMFPSGSSVEVRAYGLDKNGRIVADLSSNGLSWSSEMIRKGMGAAYECPHGRCSARPRPWCEDDDQD